MSKCLENSEEKSNNHIQKAYNSINNENINNNSLENIMPNENKNLSNDIPSKYFYKFSSNNLNSYSNQEFIKNISYDSSEVIVKCKPMINSTASKTFMKEYSISKRYEEDKALLFPSIEEKETFSKESKNDESAENEENIKENNEYEELLKYQENNLPVPIEQKDNEKFKILKMKQMKRLSMPPNKSVKKYGEDLEANYEKEFRINNAFSTMKKKKPVRSLRKLYSSGIIFNKNRKEKEIFMIFRDKDIGIYEYWQAHIHESHVDEDIETDEDQKTIASHFSISEIKEAFDFIRKNGSKSFTNFNRYKNYYRDNEAENIIDKIIYNLDNYQLRNYKI